MNAGVGACIGVAMIAIMEKIGMLPFQNLSP